MVEPYSVCAVQTITRIVEDSKTKDKIIEENLDRDLELVDFVCGDTRVKSKLIVFPEFFLTSVPESRTIDDYIMRSIYIPGPETERIAAKAREHNVYIAANAFEIHEDWPGRCFNTSFIIDPNGAIILKYRKLNDTQFYLPTNTNPGDVYSEYIERYGEDALFPVVDTPIGRLACITCYDINFPEVARCLTLKGAEILIMPTGESYTFGPKHRLMKIARAYENSVYLITANHGKFIGPRPEHQQRGYSEIIDFNGNVIECADGPGELTINGFVDIEALRLKRSRVDFYNFIVGLRGSLYAPVYEEADTWPLDYWRDSPLKSNEESFALGREIRDRLYANGVLVPPSTLKNKLHR